jgi:tRNA threonylcarbamoyladenosine biosynthesis protein TsaB
MEAPAPRALLALDTSTDTMAVALRGPAGVRHHEGEGGARASATLLPLVREMLRAQGLRAAQLQAVAFARGPGAFTGLRTACAVAQGLAFGAGCPVVPVDSLMLVAEDAAPPEAAPDSRVAVVMDARMGEVYAARLCWHGPAPGCPTGWEVVQPPGLFEPAALASWGPWLAEASGWAAGSGLALLPPGAWPDEVAVRAGSSRAGALMRLAERLWAAGCVVSAHDALPLYLRDKVALTVAERAEAAGAAPAGAWAGAGAGVRAARA